MAKQTVRIVPVFVLFTDVKAVKTSGNSAGKIFLY